MDVLFVPVALVEELLAHATALLPEEACGLLAGRDGRATRFYPVENARHSPVAYDMEPRALVRAILAIEAEGLNYWRSTTPNPAARPGRRRPTSPRPITPNKSTLSSR